MNTELTSNGKHEWQCLLSIVYCLLFAVYWLLAAAGIGNIPRRRSKDSTHAVSLQ